MSHYSVRPQLQQNAWVCTFCGAKYPSEKERDLHMAGNCKDSPTPLTEEIQPQQSRIRPPMAKAKTFSHPEEGQYHPGQDQGQGYGYGYPNPPQPLFQSQLQPPSRQNYPQRPGIPVPQQMQFPPANPWDQPSSIRGYAPPYLQQEAGHSGYGVNRGRSLPEEPQDGTRSVRPPRPLHSTVPTQPSSLTGFGDGAVSQQKNRRVSDSQERPTHYGYNAPPNEPDMSPLAKVNSPITPSGDKAKVTIIWKKEIPTLEKEVTYIDNIQDPVTLAWSDKNEFFQGNATFSQGGHTGSIFFPTSGEMEAVQPFEVKKKGMSMSMVTLKLVEVKSPIKSEPSKLPMPSPIPKLNPKNESEEAKSVPPTEKEKKGMREQLLKQNQDLKDKEERNRRMKEEMDCLSKTVDTVKDDKQKLKKEMVKLDEQLIQVMTELSSIRAYGSSDEQKLEKENQGLKNELELLRHKEPIGGDELLAAKENIDHLKSHINSMENTKQDDQLNEKIQTLETELRALQGKEEESEKIRKEQQELENTNKDLHAEVNKTKDELKALVRDREELEKRANGLQAEVTEKEKEKKSLNQEQEEVIKNLQTSLEDRDKKVSEKEKEIIDLVKSKMSFESDLNQARNELKENSGNKEATEQVEHLAKENSDLNQEIHKLREKNKKYKDDYSQISVELNTAKEEMIENKKNFEQTISETENKATKEVKELEESKQKQETELNIFKDQIQLLSKQKQEMRKKSEQDTLQYKDEVVSRDDKISELSKQIQENKQNKEEQEKIKALNEELEQTKSDYEDLRGVKKELENELKGKKNDFEEISMESTKDKDSMRDQYSKIEKEKQDLQQQVDGLHTLVNGLKDSTSKLKFKLDKSEEERDKMKTENNLEKESIKTAYLEKMKKDKETIEQLEKELKSERESSAILKQLIGKLNKEVESQTGDETAVKLKEELEKAEKYKSKLEYKLEQMSREIANRDSEIQQLSRKNREVPVEDQFTNIEIPKSDSKSKSGKSFFPNKKNEKEKPKMAATKISADIPLGAEGGSPIPTINPIQNPTLKSSQKVRYKGVTVNVLKLNALPSAKPHINKQVLCPIKKNLELGRLMAAFEVPTKVGKSSKVAKYVGVLLNEAVGDSDGTFQGTRVFECEENHGWFAPLEDVYVPVI